MAERKIRLNNAAEAGKFVDAAEKCSFDVDIFYNSKVIDAKSLIGVLSLDLRNELTVRYDHEIDKAFEAVLDQFSV